MSKEVRTRGEEFVQILIREYETLLTDAIAEVERHKRLLLDYQWTPYHGEELAWHSSMYAKDVAHYTKVLADLKGAENGITIPTAEAETPRPIFPVITKDMCILGM